MEVKSNHFRPPDGLYLRFDPQAIPGERWIATRYHEFRNEIMTVFVPRGFACDLGSIPWWARWLFSPNGNYQRAAMFHDAAYRLQFCSRFQADALLREIATIDRTPIWQVMLLYWAVRVGGREIWKENGRRLYDSRSAMTGYRNPDTKPDTQA